MANAPRPPDIFVGEDTTEFDDRGLLNHFGDTGSNSGGGPGGPPDHPIDPGSGNPGGGDPSGGDPSGGDPSGGDPSGDDPSGGDPGGGDPGGGDPSGGDPSGGDPSGGDPSGGEPLGGEVGTGAEAGDLPTFSGSGNQDIGSFFSGENDSSDSSYDVGLYFLGDGGNSRSKGGSAENDSNTGSEDPSGSSYIFGPIDTSFHLSQIGIDSTKRSPTGAPFPGGQSGSSGPQKPIDKPKSGKPKGTSGTSRQSKHGVGSGIKFIPAPSRTHVGGIYENYQDQRNRAAAAFLVRDSKLGGIIDNTGHVDITERRKIEVMTAIDDINGFLVEFERRLQVNDSQQGPSTIDLMNQIISALNALSASNPNPSHETIDLVEVDESLRANLPALASALSFLRGLLLELLGDPNFTIRGLTHDQLMQRVLDLISAVEDKISYINGLRP